MIDGAAARLALISQHLRTVQTSPDWADLPEILEWYTTDVAWVVDALSHLQKDEEMARAQLRGMQDFLSGQPQDMPFRGDDLTEAKSSSLNFAWTLGYQQAQDSVLYREMVRRADASANRSDQSSKAYWDLRAALGQLEQQWRGQQKGWLIEQPNYSKAQVYSEVADQLAALIATLPQLIENKEDTLTRRDTQADATDDPPHPSVGDTSTRSAEKEPE